MINIENLEFDALINEFKIVLKKNGLKYTKQRETILTTLYNNVLHLSPEELHLTLNQKFPELNIGIATVYRTLNLLESAGLATSISFGIQGKKFELANKPHHDHLICKICGKIVEFQDETIEKKQKEIAKKNNFLMTNHIMQLYGICSGCKSNNKGDKA